MREGSGVSWRRAGLLLVGSLWAASVLHGQAGPKSKVTVVVTEDDAPCPWAKVVIRPRGAAEGWPEGKTSIILKTDLDGKTSTTLGAGSYRITAVDSIRQKLPALAYFKIAAGQHRPMKIRLNLLYWDCAHVTCML